MALKLAFLSLLVLVSTWQCVGAVKLLATSAKPVVKSFSQITKSGSSTTDSMPFPETSLSIQKFTLEPCATYHLHTHPVDEIYYVIQGAAIAGAITGSGVVTDTLSPGKGILNKAGVPHFFYNDKCETLVAYSVVEAGAASTSLALDKVGQLSGEARARHQGVSGQISVYQECRKKCKK